MLKFIFGTLPIILSEEARNKANILKYSSNEKKILINCIKYDETFEDAKMYFDFIHLNEKKSDSEDVNKNIDNFLYYIDVMPKDAWYVLAYSGVLKKRDKIYDYIKQKKYGQSFLSTVLDKYYCSLKDFEGKLSIYKAEIYLLTSALVSVILDEAIIKNMKFTKAVDSVISKNMKDIINKINNKLNDYMNLI